MNLLNVLQVGEQYKRGGAARIEMELHENLTKYGWNSYLVAGYSSQDEQPDEKTVVLYRENGFALINRSILEIMERKRLSNLYSFFVILHIIRKHKIDIIHLHAMQGGFLGIREIKWLTRLKPVVWTIHDTWTFTGGCMYTWSCTEWKKNLCKDCKNELATEYKRSPHRNLTCKKKFLTNRNIIFVVPSKWIGSQLRKSVFAREKILNIPNGVDTDNFSPLNRSKEFWINKYHLPRTKNYILFIAIDIKSRYKGFKFFADATEKFESPQDYTLLIVGDGNCRFRLNQNCCIKTFGYVKDKMILNEIYNMADILVLPSVQENFPTVALESMAAGTPVVAFDTGGIAEQIDESVGWLVREKTGGALASVIDTALTNEENRKQKGIKARQKVLNCFSKEKMIKKYKELYTRLK